VGPVGEATSRGRRQRSPSFRAFEDAHETAEHALAGWPRATKLLPNTLSARVAIGESEDRQRGESGCASQIMFDPELVITTFVFDRALDGGYEHVELREGEI
jgi:hypothetical protein